MISQIQKTTKELEDILSNNNFKLFKNKENYYKQLFENANISFFNTCKICYEINNYKSFCSCEVNFNYGVGVEKTKRIELKNYMDIFQNIDKNLSQFQWKTEIYKMDGLTDEEKYILSIEPLFDTIETETDKEKEFVPLKIDIVSNQEENDIVLSNEDLKILGDAFKSDIKNKAEQKNKIDLDNNNVKDVQFNIEDKEINSILTSSNINLIQGTWCNNELEYRFNLSEVSFQFKKGVEYIGNFTVVNNNIYLDYKRYSNEKSMKWHATIESINEQELILIDKSNQVGRREVFQKITGYIDNITSEQTKLDVIEKEVEKENVVTDFVLPIILYLVFISIPIGIFFDAFFKQIFNFKEKFSFFYNHDGEGYFVFVIIGFFIGFILIKEICENAKNPYIKILYSENSIKFHFLASMIIIAIVLYYLTITIALIILIWSLVSLDKFSSKWEFKKTVFYKWVSIVFKIKK